MRLANGVVGSKLPWRAGWCLLDLGKCGKKLSEKRKGEVSEVKRLGWGTGASEGADSNFPRQEGTPFPGDKGLLVEDRQGLESDSAPERPPGISARSSQGTGRDPAPCVWGWGHQAE